jgi:hypothetical protein
MFPTRLIRRVAFVAVLLVASGLAARALVRNYHLNRLEPFVPTAERFLDLAIAGDSAGLRGLALDTTAAQHALAIGQYRPQHLLVARRTMRLDGGVLEPNHVFLSFRTAVDWCEGSAGATDLQVQLVALADRWLVEYAGPGMC